MLPHYSLGGLPLSAKPNCFRDINLVRFISLFLFYDVAVLDVVYSRCFSHLKSNTILTISFCNLKKFFQFICIINKLIWSFHCCCQRSLAVQPANGGVAYVAMQQHPQQAAVQRVPTAGGGGNGCGLLPGTTTTIFSIPEYATTNGATEFC